VSRVSEVTDEIIQAARETQTEISKRILRIKEIDAMGVTIGGEVYNNWRDVPQRGRK